MSARVPAGEPSAKHGWYALALLFTVALFNYIDRSLLSILQIPIKQELGLSDSEIGILTGLGFALFYTTFALPVARLADRYTRKYVLAAALAVWTAMTALGGFAGSFSVLLLCRIGVAIGEAGAVAPSLSLLTDYFPPRRRATAMAVWGLSLSLGVMLSFALGGWLASTLGWRKTFFAIGAIGSLLVPAVLAALREPARGRFDGASVSETPDGLPSLRKSLSILWNFRTFRYLCIGEALQAYVQLSLATWSAPFYARVHHMALSDIATYLALNTGLAGAGGTVLGGLLVTRLGRLDDRWYLWVPAIASLVIIPFGLGQFFVSSAALSLVLGAVPAMIVFMYLAPVNTVQQTLVPANLRAFTTSILALVVNIVGLGLGPLVTGLCSDFLIVHFGLLHNSLRYALPLQLIAALGASVFFFRAARYLSDEMASPLHAADSPSQAPSVAAPTVGA